MATHNLFKGIKRVLATNTAYTATTNNDYLYFVRESGATEGDIWFQGIHYGHFGEHDLDAINTALAGFLTGQGEVGYKDVKTYIDDAIAELAGKDSYASGESADKHVKVEVEIVDSELTAVTVTTTDIASAAELDAVEAGLGFENGTAYTNSGTYISGDTVVEDISRLDTVLGNLNDNLSDIEDALATTAATLTNMIEAEEDAREAAIEALDYTGVTPNGQAITNVTETNGVITATQGNIAAEHVTIADSGDLFTATNVEDALAELANKVNANEVESSDESIIVTPTSGKTDLAVRVDGETIVKDNSGALKTDLKLIKETTNLETNVKEQYKLVYGNSTTAIGEVIKIYKDSSLYNAYLGHVDDTIASTSDPTVTPGSGDTALCFIYHKEDGTYELVAVNVETFLEEQEFKDGLQVSNHEVSVKVDSTSEEVIVGPSGQSAPVLTVGANGVKVDHIQDAIDYAVSQQAAGVDADVTGASADGHVTVEVVQENTEVKRVVVTTDDIASATALTETASTLYNMVTAETQTRESEDDRLEELISGLTDDLAAEIAARKAVDGQNGDTYAANAGANYISSATSLNDADVKLDTALKSVDDRLDTVEDNYATAVTVNGVSAATQNNAIALQVDADHVELGTAITGQTTATTFAATEKVDDVLQSIVNVLDSAVAGSYTGVTSTGHSMVITDNTGDNGQNVEINAQSASLSKAQDGHIFLVQDGQDSDKVYAAMYWIDEETGE